MNVSLPDPPAANQDKHEPAETPNPENDGSMPVPTTGVSKDVRTTSLAPPGKPDGEVDTRA